MPIACYSSHRKTASCMGVLQLGHTNLHVEERKYTWKVVSFQKCPDIGISDFDDESNITNIGPDRVLPADSYTTTHPAVPVKIRGGLHPSAGKVYKIKREKITYKISLRKIHIEIYRLGPKINLANVARHGCSSPGPHCTHCQEGWEVTPCQHLFLRFFGEFLQSGGPTPSPLSGIFASFYVCFGPCQLGCAVKQGFWEWEDHPPGPPWISEFTKIIFFKAILIRHYRWVSWTYAQYEADIRSDLSIL